MNTSHTHQSNRTFRTPWARLSTSATLFALSGVLSFAAAANAGVDGAKIKRGDVSFSQDGNTLRVRASNGAIIEYNRFSVEAGQIMQFIQPSATSRVLNRVTGSELSRIDGSLLSNGIVYLVNPQGIRIGNGALINVGGFYAAAGAMSDKDFIRGNNNFTNLSGKVTNEGMIHAQSVALVGQYVANRGTIQVDDGVIAMASGDTVFLQHGTGPIMVTVNRSQLGADGSGAGTEAGVSNTGTINAGKGKVAMASGDFYALAMDLSGTIIGKSIAARGGAGNAPGNGGVVAVNGTLDASSTTGKGGTIDVFGERVGLMSGALVNANGATGGGSVRIGGDYLGGNVANAPQATATYIDSNARVTANATQSGDGGRVIVWSNEYTGFFGSIEASGADIGNGGFIETSSHDNLQAFGSVNAKSARGKAGTWLLDPSDVTITNSADAGGAFNSSSPNVFTPTAATATADVATVNSSLNGGTSVTINTGSVGDGLGGAGNITLAAAIAKTAGGNATLTLNAVGSITLNASITSTDGALSVALNAGTTVSMGAITTNGGDVNVNAGGGVVIAGNITVGGTGAINITGNTTRVSNAGVTMNDLVTIQTTNGDLNIRGTGGTETFDNLGVDIHGGTIQSGGTGNVTVTGTGGSVGSFNYGVQNSGTITSEGGAVTVTGTTGGSVDGAGNNYGVLNSGTITSMASGNVTVTGTGGHATRGNNIGVFNDNGSISSIDGNVTVTGTGGSGNSANVGVVNGVLGSGSTIITSVRGAVTVTGTGGSGDGNDAIYMDGGLIIAPVNLTLTSLLGAINQISGTITVVGTTTITAGANDVTLAQANNFGGAVSVVSANNVSLRNSSAFTFDASTVTGTLAVTADGAITQNAAITVGGTTSITAGTSPTFFDVTLAQATNNFGGAVSVVSANNLSLRDSDTLEFGRLDVYGNFAVTAGGAITQNAPMTVFGTTSITAGANDVTLAQPENGFVGNFSIVSANNVSLTAGVPLTLGASTVSGNLALRVSDTINQTSDAITVAGTTTITAWGTLEQTNISLAGGLNNFTGRVIIAGDASFVRDFKLRNINATPGVITNLSNATNLRDFTIMYDKAGYTVPELTMASLHNVNITTGGGVVVAGNMTARTDGVINITGNTQGLSGGAGVTVNPHVTIQTTNGNLNITGTGGNNTGGNNFGVYNNIGTIISGGIGNVTLEGTGGRGSAGFNPGVYNGDGTITSGGSGNVFVTGTGGSGGTQNRGVHNNGTVSSLGSGNVTVTGTSGIGANNAAIYMDGGFITAPRALTLIANGGAINQTSGRIRVDGTTTITAGTSTTFFDVTLAQATNNFVGAVSVISAINVSLRDSDTLTLGESNISGTVDVTAAVAINQTSDAITVDGATTLTASATGMDISLAGGENNFAGTVTIGGDPLLVRDFKLRNINATPGVDINLSNLNNLRDFTIMYDNAGYTVPSLTMASLRNVNITTGAGVVVAGNVITSGTGEINITGNKNSAVRSQYGVNLRESVTIQTIDGALNITGTGGSASSINWGIYTNAGDIICSIGSGNVTVTGTGGTSGNGNYGVLHSTGATITSGSGNVLVKGTGGGNSSAFGINNFGTITSSGTGSVTVEGVAGNIGDTNSNYGVANAASGAGGGVISSSGGTVTVVGTGAAGWDAINLYGFSSITSLGALTLTSNGGAINQVGGTITVDGTTTITAGTSPTFFDVTLAQSTNNFVGAVSVVSANNVSLADINTLTLGESNISGNLAVTAAVAINQTSDAITVAGATTLTAFAADMDISLAGGANDFAGAVIIGGDASFVRDFKLRNTNAAPDLVTNLNSASNLRDFTIIYNNAGYTVPALSSALLGNVNIDAAGITLSLNTPLTTHAGGAVTLNSTTTLSIADGADITSDGAVNLTATSGITTAGNVTTTGDDVNYESATTLTGDILVNTGAGADINFASTLNGNQSLGLTAGTGNIEFVDAVGGVNPLSAITITSANDVTAAAITASSFTQDVGTGTTSFNGLLYLTGAFDFTGNALSLNGVGKNLVGASGSGMDVTNQGLFTIANGAFLEVSRVFTQDGDGLNSIGGTIESNNDGISFKSGVTLTDNVTMYSAGDFGNNIIFSSTLDGDKTLALRAGYGDITFTGAVGAGTRLGAITITSASDVTAFAAITASSFTQDVGTGTTSFNGLLNLTGAFDFTGNALSLNGVGQNLVGASGSGMDVTNRGLFTIANGAFLEVSRVFTQDGDGLNSIGGTIESNNDGISFKSGVTLTDNVTMYSAGDFGNNIIFSSTLDGDKTLALRAGNGDITFTGAVGAGTRVGAITITSAQNVTAGGGLAQNSFNASTLTLTSVTGTATFTGPLNLTTLSSTTGVNNFSSTGTTGIITNTVAFTNTGNLTLGQTGGIQTFTNGLDTMGVRGVVTMYGTFVTGGGSLDFGNLVLATDTVYDSNGFDINFNGTVNGTNPGAQTLGLIAGAGNIQFAGIVGGVTPLGAITITSANDVTAAAAITAASFTQVNGTGTTTFNGITTTTAGALNVTTNNVTFNDAAVTFTDMLIDVSGLLTMNMQNSTQDESVIGGAFAQTGTGNVFLQGGGARDSEVLILGLNSFAPVFNATFTGAVTIDGSVGIGARSESTNVHFLNTVDSAAGASGNLALDNSNIVFDRNVGAIRPLGTFDMNIAEGESLLVSGTLTAQTVVAGPIPDLLQTPLQTTSTFEGLVTTGNYGGAALTDLNIGTNTVTLNGGITTLDGGDVFVAGHTINFANGTTIASDGSIEIMGDIQGLNNTLNLGADMTTTGGEINFQISHTALSGDVSINSAGGDITFGGTLNGTPIGGLPGRQDLNLTAGTGNILFIGDVRGAFNGLLGTVGVLSARNVMFNGTANATSFVQNTGTGTTTFNEAVTLTNNFYFNGNDLVMNGVSVVGNNFEVVSRSGVVIAADVTTQGTGVINITGNTNVDPALRSNVGVTVNGAVTIQTTNGDLNITGTGGSNVGGYNYGVYNNAGTIQSGGAGNVSVTGTGGNSEGDRNYGVLNDNNALITSGGGTVLVTGRGGNGASDYNEGVRNDNGSIVTNGVSGTVTVIGFGGSGNGEFNYGVVNLSTITSDGDIEVRGTGGNGDGGYNLGVYNNGDITSGGEVIVTGTGGTGGNDNYGVLNQGGTITSSGEVIVTGTGGTGGNDNYGVLNQGGTITSGGGPVFVTGTGGTGVLGNDAIAIQSGFITAQSALTLISNGGAINQTGGTITVVGTTTITAGANDVTLAQSTNNFGGAVTVVSARNVSLADTNALILGVSTVANNFTATAGGGIVVAGDITAGVTGTINITGNTLGLSQTGVTVNSAVTIQTTNGNLNITGTGGSVAGGYNYGVLNNGGTITSGGAGSVTVTGTGGSGAGGFNYGIINTSEPSIFGRIASSGSGTVNVIGIGGSAGGNNFGVENSSRSTITSGGAGRVFVDGQGGGGGVGSSNNWGIANAGTIGSGTDGNVFVEGAGGFGDGGSHAGIFNFGMITSGGIGNVTVRGVAGDGGGLDVGVKNTGISSTIVGTITSGGAGSVTVSGFGGIGVGGNSGVENVNGATITSRGGNVAVNGTGGSGGLENDAVRVDNNAFIIAPGALTLTSNGGAINQVGGTIAVSGATTLKASVIDTDIHLAGGPNDFAGTMTIDNTASAALNVHDFELRNINATPGVITNLSDATNLSDFTIMYDKAGYTVPLLTMPSLHNVTITTGAGVIVANNVTAGNDGEINIKGNTNSALRNQWGVTVSSNVIIQTTGGDLNITGTGGSNAGGSNFGVYNVGGTIRSGGLGNVTVEGTGGSGSGNNYGVYNGDGTITSGDSGNIFVTGTGGSGGNQNHGVHNDGTVSSLGSGDVTVAGTGAAGSDAIYLFDNSFITAPGALTLTSNGGAINQVGGTITVDGATTLKAIVMDTDIQLAGRLNDFAGTVTIDNTAGAAVNVRDFKLSNTNAAAGEITNLSNATNLRDFTIMYDNAGYTVPLLTMASLRNVNISTGAGVVLANNVITSGTGEINITGNTNSAVRSQFGVNLRESVTIQTIDGALNITGTGGSASSINWGIYTNAGDIIRSIGSGNVTVTGTGGTSGNGNYGVLHSTGATITSGSGNVLVKGTGGGNSSAFGINNFGTITSSGTGSVTVEGVAGNIGDTNSNYGVANAASGAGGGVISSSGGTVTVVGTGAAGWDAIHLFDSSSITSLGALTLTSNGGAINQVGGTIRVDGTTTISVNVASTDISLAGGPNNFAGPVNMNRNVDYVRDFKLRDINSSAGAANPDVTTFVNLRDLTIAYDYSSYVLPSLTMPSLRNVSISAINVSMILNTSLTTHDGGTVTFNATNQLNIADGANIFAEGAVNLTGTNGIFINGDITTTGKGVSFHSATKLTDLTLFTIDTTNGNLNPNGANIFFGDAITVPTDNTEALVLNAGTVGEITLTGNVGEPTRMLSNLTLTAANTIIKGDIYVAGNTTAGDITIINDTIIESKGRLTVGSIDGGGDYAVTIATVDLILTAPITDVTTLTIQNSDPTGAITLMGLGGLSLDQTDWNFIGAGVNVVLGGSNYEGTVTVDGAWINDRAVTVAFEDGGAGHIYINSPITGTGGLTIKGSGHTTTLAADITQAAIRIVDAVELNRATLVLTATAGDILIDGAITSSNRDNLTLIASENVELLGNIGTSVANTQLGTLTVDSGTNLGNTITFGALASSVYADNVKLNTGASSALATAATMGTIVSDGNIEYFTNTFAMGQNHKLTSLGGIRISGLAGPTSNATSVALGDVNAVGNLRVNANSITLLGRAGGPIVTNTGGTVNDARLDYVVGGRAYFSVAPIMGGTNPGNRAMFSNPTGNVDALGTLSLYAATAYPSAITSGLLTGVGGQVLDLSASSGSILFYGNPATIIPQMMSSLPPIGLLGDGDTLDNDDDEEKEAQQSADKNDDSQTPATTQAEKAERDVPVNVNAVAVPVASR